MNKLALLAIASVLLLSGCSEKGEGQAKKKYTIGVTLLTEGHDFYVDLKKGLMDTAEKNNTELKIVAGEWDLNRQINQVEDFITKGVNAIVVCPTDSAGIVTAVESANSAKIPVFTADISAKGGNVVCHIASDNVAGGRKAGEYLVKALDGNGGIVIIDQPVVSSVIDRVKGFEEVIARYPEMKIVAKPNGEGVKDKAMSAMEAVLGVTGLNVKGVFGINDDSALGALEAVKASGRTDIIIVGYDATQPARQAILSGGPLKADVVQKPYEIGRITIETIVKHLKGEQVPKVIPVEVGIVDKADLEAEKK